MWQLHDYTKAKVPAGYLRITRDGKRVADVFPFASDTDQDWVREQAARIVEQMNAADMVKVT